MKNLNVVQTQDAVFSLELTHENVKGAQWIKNGVEITSGDKYDISSEGTVHTLKIKNCTSHDESVYSFRLGKLSANARLNVESEQMPKPVHWCLPPKMIKILYFVVVIILLLKLYYNQICKFNITSKGSTGS